MKRRSVGARCPRALDRDCLRLIGCLAALVMGSEAGAGLLFSRSFAAGDRPFSVAESVRTSASRPRGEKRRCRPHQAVSSAYTLE